MKKWFPFLALLVAALFFWWVKSHQRGRSNEPYNTPSVNHLVFSKHAKCRMDCRQITSEEIKKVLLNGKVNESKTQFSDKGTSYAVEGIGDDNEHLRIVYSPHNEETVIVTVIDLDKEWPCNCN